MDATQIFRQGLGTVAPRQQTFDQFHGHGIDDDDFLDGDSSGQRVAHTLTACCRCRQRKTRCDPSLPRCRPCEKSGSVCEYLDAAKGRKINRFYVIKLQDKVRALEAELDQYTDDAADYPRTNEDIIRPGGMIRLSISDETPRYLGPSSGIAMTRLLMEEAKRYTETNSVSELIPEVRARRQARMQSIQMTGAPNVRKKSFPMMSEHPAETLPNRSVAQKLLNGFYKKSQVFWPIVHEKSFEADVDAVYKGDTDSYKNFIVRMAFAISLQKADRQYAGLADGYYKSAMKYFEDVVRPKDLKTLQCLALAASYSLITPSRLATYYVIGLATRICQQEGLTDENTISTGDNVDPLTLDMRRRLVWIIATMEFGLSYYMGRPTGFAKGDDRMDVEFFSTVADENITETGIKSGPDDPRKLISIQFYKMRVYQAEIRRTLYEKKRAEPNNDSHQWYNTMENKLVEWRDSSPPGAGWSKAWFTGLYHELRAFMYRPSPQIPQPSSRAAGICYESSAYIIDMTKKSLDSGSVDATWVFLVSLTTALNTLLWSTSYEEVRQNHSREEAEEYVNKTLDSLDRCAERWPGTASASEMYAIFSKACLQSYDMAAGKPMFSFASPSSTGDHQASPPQVPVSAADPSQVPFMNPPHFGYVFDSPPESMNTYTFDPNFPPPQPTFRSNSIFCNPTSTDTHGRRFSYFPPDFSQPTENTQEDPAGNTIKSEQDFTSPSQMSSHLPTPPESIPPSNLSNATPSVTFSPTLLPEQVTGLSDVSAGPMSMPLQAASTPPQKHMIPKADPSQQDPTFTIAPQVTQPTIQQRPLPTTTDWFSPLPPFVSPYSMGPSMSNNFFNEAMSGAGGFGEVPRTGMNMGNMNMRQDMGPPYGFNQARQGSLTQSQQLELMNMLETEGMGDLDNFLNTGNAMTTDGRWY